MKKSYKQPEVGDKVEVILMNKRETGILLESHDPGVILLKLSNGYNIGIKKEDVSEIKILVKRIEKKEDKTEFKLSGQKPVIELIVTGGTISSKLDPKTGAVKSLIDSKDLFSIYPEIFEIADIKLKSPFMKLSENMNPLDWVKLAKVIGKSLNDPNVKGVIVTHGTDTLHYTASALSFMLGKVNKPVVLTYSQRSSDRGSSDSRMNLICSAYTALSDISEVMLVGHATSNDDFCYILNGTKVRKMHTSKRNTFRPINTSPLGKIWADGKIEILKDHNKREKKKVKIDCVFDNMVALLKFYPGQDPSILDYYKKKGYKAIIIEMTGLGHVCTEGKYNFLPKIRSLIKSGMQIYAVNQTLYGRLDPNVYSPGRKLEEAGVVYLEDILAETAFVKLGWILSHKEWRGSAITPVKMKENICGEFNDRLGEDEFLN